MLAVKKKIGFKRKNPVLGIPLQIKNPNIIILNSLKLYLLDQRLNIFGFYRSIGYTVFIFLFLTFLKE